MPFLWLKSQIRKCFKAAGLDLVAWQNSNSERALGLRLLEFAGANLVLDVGANQGQFAEELLLFYPTIEMVSFEPLREPYAALSLKAKKHPAWRVAPRCALGSEVGIVRINIAGNSVSSSLLSMNESHVIAAPDSSYISKEEVPVCTLAEAASEYLRPDHRIFLKIDTQGTEDEVLRGAMGILAQVVAIKVEASFIDLYQGQCLAPDLMKQIEQYGFKLFGIANGFRDPKTKVLLQADFFYLRI